MDALRLLQCVHFIVLFTRTQLQVPQIDAVLSQIIFSYGFDDFVKCCGKSALVLRQGSLKLKCV